MKANISIKPIRFHDPPVALSCQPSQRLVLDAVDLHSIDN
jgi:hypothetical protein